MSRRRKILLAIITVIVIGFIGLQLIPPEKVFPDFKYPGSPAVDPQFQWDSPQTEQLARSACYELIQTNLRKMPEINQSKCKVMPAQEMIIKTVIA